MKSKAFAITVSFLCVTSFAAPRLNADRLKAQDDVLFHKIYDDHDATARERNFAEAYPRALEAWADDTLPARVRLAVIGTAGKACARAMRNHSSPTGATFHNCPAATNSVALIELLTKALDTIPKGPPGMMNVSPPLGGFPSGISPSGIEDPVARAAYEKVIAENSLRIEEGNARHRVSLALQDLETAVWCVMREIQVGHEISPLPEQIRASSLPEKTKERFLSGKFN